MQSNDQPFSERIRRHESLQRLRKADCPSPFVDKVFEITFLGTVTALVGMAAIGSVLGQ